PGSRFCLAQTKCRWFQTRFFQRKTQLERSPMAPKHIRVLLPRNTQPDHDVEEVGGSVLANVCNNKNFTALLVDQAMLQAALTDFTASIAATIQADLQATNEKNKKKHELVALPAKARTPRSGQRERGSGDPDVQRFLRTATAFTKPLIFMKSFGVYIAFASFCPCKRQSKSPI